MNHIFILRLLVVLFLSTFISGCAQLIGSLRPNQESEENTELDAYSVSSEFNPDYTFHSLAEQETRPHPSAEDTRAPASVMSQTSALDVQTQPAYKNGFRASRADFIDDAPNEGSLWASDGQTNYYFTKNKVKSVGDLVSIQLEADIAKEIQDEIRRTLPVKEKEKEVSILMEKWEATKEAITEAADAAEAKALALAAEKAERLEAQAAQEAEEKIAAAANKAAGKKTERAPAAASAVTPASSSGAGPGSAKIPPEPTFSDVDLTKSLEIKAGDTMLVEIVERFPNGNYKVRGIKKVSYKNGAPKHVGVTAIVRSTDLGGEEEILNSGKLYEHRVEALRN